MRGVKKSKLPLIIGVGLPLLLVFWVLAANYFLPNLLVRPRYDFVYVTGYDSRYVRVLNGRVTVASSEYRDRPDFYLYDVKGEENIPLTFNETQSYELDPSEKSPDGYVVYSSKDYSGDYFLFPFFWGVGSRQGSYIGKSTNLRKQISLKGNYYYKFVGWVLSE